MKLAPDTRYTNYRQTDYAVNFDGQYFVAYVIGQENTNVSITMEILVGVYPEVKGKALKRLEKTNKNGTSYGLWMLVDENTTDDTKQEEKSWSDLQERTRIAMQRAGHRADIVDTLEKTVDRLDQLLQKSKQPSAWANVMLPIIQAAEEEGVSMDDILDAGYRKIEWIESPNKKKK